MILRGQRLLVAEICLTAVTLSVAVGFGRLFEGGGWLLPLVAVATMTHIVSGVLRRLDVGVPLQVAGVALGTILLMAWTQASDTLRFGLPTFATLSQFGTALDEALVLYPEARSPVEPVVGFVLASMLGIAIVATMSDIAAFRLGAEIQALIPPLTLFLFCSLLGSGEHQVVAALSFMVTCLMFVVVMRSLTRRSATTWLPGDDGRGPGALVKLGGSLTAVAAIAAVLVGPALPGAGDEGLWTWRGGIGPGTRIIISPLVDIRSRLVNQSDEIAFVVRSSEPSYMRLMALDAFDGESFRLETNFRPVSRNLATTGMAGVAQLVEQRVVIEQLASPYLPAAFEPVRIDAGDEPLRWDDRSSTLLLESDQAPRGLEYVVESTLPEFDPDDLRAAPDDVLPSIRDRYLELPDLDPRVVELADTIVEGAASPYDRALALQNHLREFEYSLTVPAGHSGSALARFLLVDRAGYCEQFSAAFAAMARSVGLPSRVAVGFTVGETSEADPDEYTVRGANAHAWPEVWFSGIGWVPFEPTPGRGDPQSAAHTGVTPQQVGGPETTTTTTTVPGDAPSTTFDPSLLPDFVDEAPGGAGSLGASDNGPPILVKAIAVALAVVAVWMALVAAAIAIGRAWRRRRAGDDAAAQIGVAWAEVVAAARSIRAFPRPAETHREFARRLDRLVDTDTAALTRLAEQAAAARYAGVMSPDDSEVAWSASRQAIAAIRSARSPRQRLVDLVDPRRAITRRNPTQGRRHATLTTIGEMAEA